MRVGEIWFETQEGATDELLIKYLFTSEKLSIQVHPDDELAGLQGLARGKDEAWIVLKAEDTANIGLGLREHVDKQTLREAALNGSIEQLLSWHCVSAGDFYYSPAGTIHAIGPGLTLIEVQQNTDITYRLYDYGRPRELHVDMAVAAVHPYPYQSPCRIEQHGNGRTILVHGVKFVVERWKGPHSIFFARAEEPMWIIPIAGVVHVERDSIHAGDVGLLDVECHLRTSQDSDLLIAYPGSKVRKCAKS